LTKESEQDDPKFVTTAGLTILYIYNFIHHQTMIANSKKRQTNRNNKELGYINYNRTKSVATRPIFYFVSKFLLTLEAVNVDIRYLHAFPS